MEVVAVIEIGVLVNLIILMKKTVYIFELIHYGMIWNVDLLVLATIVVVLVSMYGMLNLSV